MSTLTNQKKKEIAEDLFIRANVTAKEIADQIGVSEQTLVKWKKQGKWDDRKNELTVSPLRIKELLMREANKIANGEKSEINCDALSKLTSAIDRIDKRISVRMVMDVLRELDNWMAQEDPKKAVEFTKYHKKFLQHRINMEV